MNKNIGSNLRKLRELKNFSQSYVADKLLVSQTMYSDIENGKKRLTDERLEQIAKILGVSKEVIEKFSEEVVFNSCVQSGYINTNYLHPVEKIDALYNEIIHQLNERIKLLEEVIKLKG